VKGVGEFFKVGAAGTVEVDGVTGFDTWGAGVDSGHYVLRDVAGDEVFAGVFDGYAHAGFLAGKK
jgi:hypothetical protein